MIARDIMTTNVVTIKLTDRVEDVAKLLVEHKISGVPVVDDDMKLLGIVSENDLIIKSRDLDLPFYVTLFDSIIFLENPNKFKDNLRKFTGIEVRDVMTPRAITVREDADIKEVANLMTKKNINRVPVVRDDKLVGIISRHDLLKTLVK
ncbi:MAG: CBS domain-containing protein [Syntrophomonadaceae bacterium]|nr:CBS domain-containing protein [Syntrophomonadaceae bacterium]